ncbi:MAG: AarF/UbiB family protein, partial [Pseudomonadota bacterium]
MEQDQRDSESNRLSARAARYLKVGGNVGTIAAKVAGQRLFGFEANSSKDAADLARALGGLKGPMMKVAQLLSTIPEALPAEYARELAQLQANAPAMGPVFVKRRMKAELGDDWANRFQSFETTASASASLGQVHKAKSPSGEELACKLQYPDMQSAVEADVNQLGVIFSIHARMNPAVDTAEMLKEIATRLREELDYELEARHMALYAKIFTELPEIRVPDVYSELTTKRLLSMSWLHGAPLMSYKEHSLEDRNTIARAMFRAWWFPFSHFGVIHGDPHLGNYTVFEEDGHPAGINLLD